MHTDEIRYGITGHNSPEELHLPPIPEVLTLAKCRVRGRTRQEQPAHFWPPREKPGVLGSPEHRKAFGKMVRVQRVDIAANLKTCGNYGKHYLCTYDLYGPVRNAFDAGSILYEGKWEGVGPWKS